MQLLPRFFALALLLPLVPWQHHGPHAGASFHLMSGHERQQARHAACIARHRPVAALHWALRQRDVAYAALGPDGHTLEMRFRDGARVVLLPGMNVRHRARAVPPSLVPMLRNVKAGASGRAAVLAPFATALGQGDKPDQTEVDALTKAGFTVDVFRDAAVTIPVIEDLSKYSVVYMETHSGVLPGGDALVLSGEEDRPSSSAADLPYASLRHDNSDPNGYPSVVQGIPQDGSGKIYIAFTMHLITAHAATFPDSSIVFLNGCSLLSAPAFTGALLAKHVAAVLSWDQEAFNSWAEQAADFMFPRLAAGKGLGRVLEDAQTAGVTTSPAPTGVAHLGFRGDGDVTFAKALAGATPTPVPTVTSTPTSPATPTATPSAATADTLSVSISGTTRARHDSTVRVTVLDAARSSPVAGARVQLDGRKVGLAHLLKKRTGSHGIATFKHVRPQRRGKLLVVVSKAGFPDVRKRVNVKP